jgi:hypothetical protein
MSLTLRLTRLYYRSKLMYIFLGHVVYTREFVFPAWTALRTGKFPLGVNQLCHKIAAVHSTIFFPFVKDNCGEFEQFFNNLERKLCKTSIRYRTMRRCRLSKNGFRCLN